LGNKVFKKATTPVVLVIRRGWDYLLAQASPNDQIAAPEQTNIFQQELCRA
jgi:hypothetical protein